jgi:hypothetical protein
MMYGTFAAENTIYNSNGDGIYGFNWALVGSIVNNLIARSASSGKAIDLGGTGPWTEQAPMVHHNAFYANAGGNYAGVGTGGMQPGDQTIAGSYNAGTTPFAAESVTGSGDWSLDPVRAAAFKGTGFFGLVPGLAVHGYLDMGSLQHQDSSVSGGEKSFTFAK